MRSLIRIASSAAVLCVAGVALAEAPAAGPKAPPAPPPAKLLMPPAPVNDGTMAYQFRTRVSTAPQCQRFAVAADSAFLDERTSISTKAALLKKIEAEAQAGNCLVAP